jgi:hypothetical protein
MLVLILPGPAMAVVLGGVGAAPLPNETWSDGIATYSMVPPLAGYLVPKTIFEKGYQVPLKDLLAVSRPMTNEELQRYTTAGSIKAVDGYPLFVFENQKVNVFLWKGKRDSTQQQIVPRVWNGELWMPKGYGPDRADAIEHVFYHPADQDRCYIMVHEQGGPRGQDRVQTERIWFGRFPPVEAILKDAIKNADAVVHLPSRGDQQASELLDCLKGDVSRSALRTVPGIERAHDNPLVFLRRDGEKWAIRSFYQHGSLSGDHGELRLSIPQVKDVLARNDWLKEYLNVQPMRWHLARLAAVAGPKDAVTLRQVNPEAKRDQWLIFELAAGKDRPGALYQHPVTRSQRDGGQPLFQFTVERGETKVDLSPRGRFGEVSLSAAEPEASEALRCQYRFIDCGPGVIKLAIKPREYPFQAKVSARFTESDRLASPEVRTTYIGSPITVEVK